MNFRNLTIAMLVLFIAWPYAGPVQAGSGSPAVRPQKSFTYQKRSPTYNVGPQKSRSRVQSNEMTETENKRIEEQNEEIEEMKDEAKKLEEELKELEQGGGG